MLVLRRSWGDWSGTLALWFIALASAVVVPVNGAPRPPVVASSPSGLYDTSFKLTLAFSASEAELRYTLDGGEPTAVRGGVYHEPLLITNTTVLRVAAYKDHAPISTTATYSYIFPDLVLRQPRNPPGYPAGPSAWSGEPSAYEMDPRVVEFPTYHDRVRASLRALPSLSIVCSRGDLFSARTGLYLNSMQRGENWERPCSVELILPEGGNGFQIDCGIRIQGNYNRIPMKSPKHSFRLLFKEKYGASKLHYPVFPDSPVRKFDTLVLRADYNNSWIHWEGSAQARAQRTRDAWMKDSHRAMGWLAGHNRYVHLFLNGLYWGLYDIAERPDASFAAAYLGGNRQDYDVVNEFQVKGGTIDGFNELRSVHGLARASQYEKLQRWLDLTQFMDYLLLNYYGGNRDWGENKNWYAIRRRSPPGPFQYMVWDGEQVLQRLNDDTVNAPQEPPFRLAEELCSNPEFRLAFADRARKHLFDDGALTPVAVAARWMQRAKEIDLAIIAESARWGGYRRDPPYTRDQDWLAEQQRLIQSYFPKRTAVVLKQLRAAGLYPQVAAPVFNQYGGPVKDKFELLMSSAGSGTVYFTTNGTDPRVRLSGAVAPEATSYAQPLPLYPPLQVKARTRQGDVWSALTEATFSPSAPAPSP